MPLLLILDLLFILSLLYQVFELVFVLLETFHQVVDLVLPISDEQLLLSDQEINGFGVLRNLGISIVGIVFQVDWIRLNRGINRQWHDRRQMIRIHLWQSLKLIRRWPCCTANLNLRESFVWVQALYSSLASIWAVVLVRDEVWAYLKIIMLLVNHLSLLLHILLSYLIVNIEAKLFLLRTKWTSTTLMTLRITMRLLQRWVLIILIFLLLLHLFRSLNDSLIKCQILVSILSQACHIVHFLDQLQLYRVINNNLPSHNHSQVHHSD